MTQGFQMTTATAKVYNLANTLCTSGDLMELVLGYQQSNLLTQRVISSLDSLVSSMRPTKAAPVVTPVRLLQNLTGVLEMVHQEFSMIRNALSLLDDIIQTSDLDTLPAVEDILDRYQAVCAKNKLIYKSMIEWGRCARLQADLSEAAKKIDAEAELVRLQCNELTNQIISLQEDISDRYPKADLAKFTSVEDLMKALK